jgi:hypothetical protein
MTTSRKILLGSALGLGIGLAPLAAHANPYAFASNDITGLIVTFADGTQLNPTGATTGVNDSANFGAFPGASNSASGVVGTALSVAQAYSGPGPAPPQNTFTQALTSTTGTRGEAFISSGTATTGGVGVQNVAEGNGTGSGASGSSTGGNTAALTFTVVGTGKAVKLTFSDAISLIASTDPLSNESATSSIANTFEITPQGQTTPIDTFAPGALNANVASQNGVPPTNTDSGTFSESHTTPILANGVTYTISFISTANENITPSIAVPEPVSLVMLGSGLLGLGAIRRRRR